jgi:hypothetical protein
MDEQQLERARDQIRSLYQKKRQELEAEEQSVLHSIDVLGRLAPEINFDLPSAQNGDKPKKVKLKAAVGAIFPDLPNEFDINHVIELIRARYAELDHPNPTSVSSLLRKLRGLKVEVAAPGSGQKPSVYRKLPNSAPIVEVEENV